jgi:uncharacterized membrane protein YczE
MNTSNHVDATSTPSHTAHSSVKEKAIEEFRLLWIIAIYLAVMLSAFAWYRRLVLAEAGLSYLHYGAAVIEALVLAKVILIGEALGLGRRFEGSPLIVSVLFKALVFGLFIALFNKLEDAIVGLIHRESWDQIAHSLFGAGQEEYLARTVIAIVTLIPFFAFWETARVMGQHKLFDLFFHKRAA